LKIRKGKTEAVYLRANNSKDIQKKNNNNKKTKQKKPNKQKRGSTKHYTENCILTTTNPLKSGDELNWGKQFLLN
jgi:hypothetical protein